MSESEALRKRFEAAMMPNYGTPPLALARGDGCRVWRRHRHRRRHRRPGILLQLRRRG